jgi:hypothetical protein
MYLMPAPLKMKQLFSPTNRTQNTFTQRDYFNTENIVNKSQVFARKNCPNLIAQKHFKFVICTDLY